jgi:photosynthetic reaction center H subunit
MPLIPITDAANARLPGGLDVKGWEVRTDRDDADVGKVEDILVDDSGRARYLDVDLGTFRRHVLVPIGLARADRSARVVRVTDMDKDRIRDVPEYGRNPTHVDRDYERLVAAAYSGPVAERETVAPDGLAKLKDLDKVQVASDEPNPKGWEVFAADGQRIGQVDELIVDTNAMKVRYFDVDLATKDLGFRGDRHILVPADQARLDRDDKHVFVEGLRADSLSDYPVYGGLPLSHDFDSQIRRRFEGARTVDEAREDLYDESAFLGDRSGTTRRDGLIRIRGADDIEIDDREPLR